MKYDEMREIIGHQKEMIEILIKEREIILKEIEEIINKQKDQLLGELDTKLAQIEQNIYYDMLRAVALPEDNKYHGHRVHAGNNF